MGLFRNSLHPPKGGLANHQGKPMRIQKLSKISMQIQNGGVMELSRNSVYILKGGLGGNQNCPRIANGIFGKF